MQKSDAFFEEYGVVAAVNHPLVEVRGLPSIQPGELVYFQETDALGRVLSFNSQTAEVMVFCPDPIRVGSQVEHRQAEATIPVGPELLGKIISPLGEPLQGKLGKLENLTQQALERPLPTLFQRRRIMFPLKTGVSLVDLMLPLGKGQRELLAGDRKTGKTNFALKTMRQQAQEGSIIIYAAIAKKTDEVKRMFQFCQQFNFADQVVMVASFPQEPASIISLTPHTAMSVAEYFRDQGKDVLVVFDDLTNHAKYYRELALLGRRFPGRDSYPGDIFYEHARLLERGGSFLHPQDPEKRVHITCLPMAETTDSNLTEYIISNLISITDGHLLFDTNLFQQGRRPAIHTSLSVTRVGKQTQTPLQRDMTRKLSSFFNKFEKTKNLTHFAAEISPESQRLLQVGKILQSFFDETSELSVPTSVQLTMVSMIWQGWLTTLGRKTLQRYRDSLIDLSTKDPEILEKLAELCEAETFDDFIKITKDQQHWLLQLCQTSADS